MYFFYFTWELFTLIWPIYVAGYALSASPVTLINLQDDLCCMNIQDKWSNWAQMRKLWWVHYVESAEINMKDRQQP